MDNQEIFEKYEMQLKRKEKKSSNKSTDDLPCCMSFCPKIEETERKLKNDISIFENKFLIKKYQRSVAGKQKPLPEEIRPIPVLKKCMNYLYSLIINTPDSSFLELYQFIEDRSRAVRLDFAIQEETEETFFEVQKMIRFYILSNKLINDSKFEIYINMEQIKKMLLSLFERKTDFLNSKKLNSSVEEFISYYILVNLDDKHIFSNISKYLKFNFLKINKAIQIYNLYNQNDFYNFFIEFNNLDLFSKHILLKSKSLMWEIAINSLKTSLNEVVPVNKIVNFFNCQDLELKIYFKKYGFELENEFLDFKEKKYLPKNTNEYFKSTFVKNINFFKLVFYGDLDFLIRKNIIYNFIEQKILKKNCTSKNVIRDKNLVNKEDKNIINSNLKAKILQITILLIIKYKVVEIINRILKENFLNRKLAIVYGTNIINIAQAKKIATNLSELKPTMFKLSETSKDLLIQFNLTIFCLEKKDKNFVFENFFMIKKIFCINEIKKILSMKNKILEIVKEPKIVKKKLSNLLINKTMKKKSKILLNLINNKYNSNSLVQNLELVYENKPILDCDVYFLEDENLEK